ALVKDPFNNANYWKGKISQKCPNCSWENDELKKETNACPKCNFILTPENSKMEITIGDTRVRYRFHKDTFSIDLSWIPTEIRLSASDLPDMIRFMIKHFRGWDWYVEHIKDDLKFIIEREDGSYIYSDLIQGMDKDRNINNELAVPAFRKFCRDNNLNFHFQDELPKSSQVPEISIKEFPLIQRALELFNFLHPRYYYYKGDIISFDFSGLFQDMVAEKYTLDSFISKMDQTTKSVEILEKTLNRQKNNMNKVMMYAVAVTIIIALIISAFSLFLIEVKILGVIIFLVFFTVPLIILNKTIGKYDDYKSIKKEYESSVQTAKNELDKLRNEIDT
ncbi:MAG TPA: hypothetical protein PKY81_16950, partial [bacterium]|nr:hypothetical protein [bacterium]